MMIQKTSPCCGELLFQAEKPDHLAAEVFLQAWKDDANNQNGHGFECPGCGGYFRTQDDGIPAGDGGGLMLLDESKPRIDSLTIGSGSRTGGEALYINGASLDSGTLSVTFAGKPVKELTDITTSSARVVSPVGTYRLLPEGDELVKLSLSNRSGTPALNEELRQGSKRVGVIRLVEADEIRITLDSGFTNSITSLIGNTVKGSSSGFTATVSTAIRPEFIDGEEVVGQTGGAKGVLRSREEWIVDSPTRAYQAGELVKGSSSGTYIRLVTPAYSGAVDVAVSNERGQRDVGSVLKNGFTYL